MGETILEMRKVTKRFPGVIALKDVSIELRKTAHGNPPL